MVDSVLVSPINYIHILAVTTSKERERARRIHGHRQCTRPVAAEAALMIIIKTRNPLCLDMARHFQQLATNKFSVARHEWQWWWG